MVTQGSTVVTTQYFDGFQYVDNVLQFFPHAEGYVKNTVVNGTNVYNYAFHYTDHLGNVRLTYGIDPATGLVTVMEENNYYPFGLKHTNYNVTQKDYIKNGGGVVLGPCSSCPNRYQYKYNGKELQDELGLNMYDYHAMLYDPATGRRNNIDPLAEKSRRWSPYSYVLNNPVYFIDPDGMEAQSPIYGSRGQFLGTDDKGFTGEAIFMNEATFSLLGGYNNGTDDSKKGGISHDTAMLYGQTLDGVIGDNPSETFNQGEVDMVNNAITHMVSKTQSMDFSASDLHNGKTSSSYFEQGNPNSDPPIPQVFLTTNGAKPQGYIVANTDRDATGDAFITYNLREFRGKCFTVENVQNTWVHEKGEHYNKNAPGGSNPGHAQAIYNQTLHPSWKGTTEQYKINMRNVYKSYTGKPLNR